MSRTEEQPPPDEPLGPNQEWLRYQQRAAQQLAGEPSAYSRTEADDTRRLSPQPLGEARLNELHAANQTNSDSDAGTLVTDYVGSAPHASFSIPAPGPIVPVEAEATQPVATSDRALPWAKRLAFALLGAFSGTYLYSAGFEFDWNHLNYLINPAVIAAPALFLAYLMRRSSNYAKYGAIAVTMTLLLTLPLLLSRTYFAQAAEFLQDPTLNNPNPTDTWASEIMGYIKRDQSIGLFYVGTGIGMGLLATFAVLRSLRVMKAIAGLLPITVAAVVEAAVQNPNSLTDIILYAVPLLLIFLYLMPGGRRADDQPLDSRR